MKDCCPPKWINIFKAISDKHRQNILFLVNEHKKINATGIANFFDEIIITPDSKELILEKILKQFDGEKDIWFVNDKIKETKKIIQYHPKLKPILKMSPMFAKEEYELSQMPHFSTLTEIQQYVEQQFK
mgnify:CR=1 FL=1